MLFKQLCVCGWNVAMPNVSGVLRSADSSEGRAGSFAVWRLAGGFLLLCLPARHRKEKKSKSPGLCLQKQPGGPAERQEGGRNWRDVERGGSPCLPRSGVHTREILSRCCSQWLRQLLVRCWGKGPRFHLPFPLLEGRTGFCVALGLSPARGVWGGSQFLRVKTAQAVKGERVMVISNREGIRLCFLVRFWVSWVNLWKLNCLINFYSTQQVNRQLITMTYSFIAVFLRQHLRLSSVTCLCCLLIIYQGFTSTGRK